MSESIFIGVNKKKLRLQALILGVGAILSIILFFGIADNQEFINPIILKALGSGLTFILILSGAAKARKFKDDNAGVLIDSEGIHDLSSDISIGLIKWTDISDIDREDSLKHGLLLIKVKKENQYLKKAKNSAIARLLKQNIRLYKTPIAINPSSLNCTLEELIDHIESYKN